MQDIEYKTFESNLPQGFDEFKNLNNLLEAFELGKEDLKNEILKVIQGNDLTDDNKIIYLEIHKLIFEVRIDINKLINFMNLKYTSYNEMCIIIISQISQKNKRLGKLLYRFNTGKEKELTILENVGKTNFKDIKKYYDYNKLSYDSFYRLLLKILKLYDEENIILN